MRYLARALMAFLAAGLPIEGVAGLFGPSNFEECVLEKMKGQSPNMMGIARQACEKDFPPEEELKEGVDYRKGQILAAQKWSATSADTITWELSKNESSYKIVKARGQFWQKKCDDNTDSGEFVEAEAKAPMFGSGFKFKLDDAAAFQCGRVTWIGVKKR